MVWWEVTVKKLHTSVRKWCIQNPVNNKMECSKPLIIFAKKKKKKKNSVLDVWVGSE